MDPIDRRALLRRGAAVAGGAAVTALATPGTSLLDPAGAVSHSRRGPVGARITSSDPRYVALTTGNNQRWVARPDYIKMIRSSDDAAEALRSAYAAGKRVSVRSGGHCFSDAVCHSDVEAIVDFSEMTDVTYDPDMRAFAVEPGARLIHVYEALYKGWGVSLPAGVCYSVGMGGHVAGGGYGMLSRANGLVPDHLYAVEVATVDARGRVRTVTATRDARDPDRDLWWGHTGGGGGNFGLVTRYWFRSPGRRGSDPGELLMRPPSTVLIHAHGFAWSQLDEAGFVRLLKNYGAWHEANSGPDSPGRHLTSILNISSRAGGMIGMITQVDASAPNADGLVRDYLATVGEGVGVAPAVLDRPTGEMPALPQFAAPREVPWLTAARLFGISNSTLNDPTLRGHHKSAYFRQNFTDDQAVALHATMSDPAYQNPRTMCILFGFGGQVNAAAADATAAAQRSSVVKMLLQTFWTDPAADANHIGWLRGRYADIFAATGGVPGVDGQTDGCFINYPDADLADPAVNTSGTPWHRLYYKDNYARLQQVKSRWDPSDYFRHSLSIAPA